MQIQTNQLMGFVEKRICTKIFCAKRSKFSLPVKMAGKNVNIDESQTEENENQEEVSVNEAGDNSASDRLIKLPLTRIKTIMKSDPDVTLASQEAVVALAKATELFIQMFSKDASSSTLQGKRKTLQRKDLDHVMDRKDCYLFLDGTLDGT